MHIGIDISQIVYEGTGVARFTHQLVSTILTRKTGHTWTIFFSSLKQELNADIRDLILHDHTPYIRWVVPPRALSVLWNEDPFRKVAPVPGHFDLFISSDWTQPPPRIARTRVTIVHDLIFRRLPQTVDPLIIATQTKRLAHVTHECQLVFCDSRSTAKDFGTYYPDFAGKVIVNYPGVVVPSIPSGGDFPFPFKPHHYFFAVGKIEPRKNLPRLITAFRSLMDEADMQDLHLVIAGPRGWDHETAHLTHPHIHLLGNISDHELGLLYANARAFVFPSLYEGFGIPPLEAMALGCPVIMSRVSSLTEIADDSCAIFIDPESTASIRSALIQVAQDRERVTRLAEHAKTQARRFTYHKYLDTMLESIERIL